MNAPRKPQPSISLDDAALGALMPMSVVLSPVGHIQSVGPTLARVTNVPMIGRRVLEVFEVRRPSCPDSFKQLMAFAGRRLTLQLRADPRTTLKGIIVPMAGGHGAILNLSFGIGVVDSVARLHLTARDFAPTDLTVEMLYLVEAKSAAMDELRRLNQKLEGARSAAEEQALTDALTGLSNRRALEEALSAQSRKGERFGLIHMDLDRFKSVNDTFGHSAGDTVLLAVAKALRAELRENDLAARVGGDEFALIFPGMTDTGRLQSIAERMIKRIEEPVDFCGQPCRISASAGITVSTFYADPQVDRMLQDADNALYASKRAGRGRATVHQEACA